MSIGGINNWFAVATPEIKNRKKKKRWNKQSLLNLQPSCQMPVLLFFDDVIPSSTKEVTKYVYINMYKTLKIKCFQYQDWRLGNRNVKNSEENWFIVCDR